VSRTAEKGLKSLDIKFLEELSRGNFASNFISNLIDAENSSDPRQKRCSTTLSGVMEHHRTVFHLSLLVT